MTRHDPESDDRNLDDLADRLEAVGRRERQHLAETATMNPVSGEERALEALRETIHADLRARDASPDVAKARPSLPVVVPLVAAAAALLLALFVWQPWRSTDSAAPGFDPNVKLGGALEALSPTGNVARYAPWRWRGDLPDGGHFVVRVYDATLALVAQSDPIRGTEWTPPNAQEFPNTIRWTVSTYGPDDVRQAIDEASADASRD